MVFIKLGSRLAFVVAIAATFGCSGGDGLPRQAVSGKVTLDGQPLDSATISFQPMAGSGEVTSAAATVSAGSFSISAADGLVPGKYRVSVSAKREVAAKSGAKKKQIDNVTGELVDPPADAAVTQETIPARFNAQTELTTEVTAAGPNDFTFAVTSK
ncbi:carboxypeptidase regulatory-like domain-containing protein [Paludisphaera rhizosphaerae]|uniref:carboxypeptidase regulatory-like domain-containing protein n=1 Tax=Paludisphaera rhizosphaerae TaxID=2711216 RepID=UPI0013EAE234|nr:carboxypeptidase regulatory-like domain-containing protein [Paludisphaera rhizosphaerae]